MHVACSACHFTGKAILGDFPGDMGNNAKNMCPVKLETFPDFFYFHNAWTSYDINKCLSEKLYIYIYYTSLEDRKP